MVLIGPVYPYRGGIAHYTTMLCRVLREQKHDGSPTSLQQARDAAEREHLRRALDESGWNVSAAARALGMERTNLHKRIRALGLKRTR